MSGITFLSENLFDTASLSLTTGSENAQFPLENLKNDSPSIKFRSVGATAVILIDLLATRDIDYVAVAADPLTSFLINSASVKTSSTTDFSASMAHAIDLSEEQAIGFVNLDEVSHRYVELTLVGSADFTELGKVFIGKGLNIPLNSFSIGSFKYKTRDRSSTRENKYGTKFTDVLNQQKDLGGTIQYCTKDEQEQIDDMMIRHGQAYPLWLILDSQNQAMNNGKFKLTIYGYLETDPEWKADGGQLYSVDMLLRQAI